jgi:ribose transport system ATP-binding protein
MVGIKKSFPGVLALKGVDLTLYPGEVHVIMGENGAGKSTLMKILSGNYRADEGEIYLEGEIVHIPTPHAAKTLGISIIHRN